VSIEHWLAWALAATLCLYAAGVGFLYVAGRRSEARALAGFIPDCIVLLGRLVRDGRIPIARKLVLAGVLGYLSVPLDLVPDFIPVAGQLDDAILVAWALRAFVKNGGRDLVNEHWPGPEASLRAILRMVG
jgi:uncharacterized membrane protein YkvA (DUF1232 family)